MKEPGIGTRRKRFKKLIGRGKKNKVHGRIGNKSKTKKRKKLSGNVRTRRTRRNKDICQ